MKSKEGGWGQKERGAAVWKRKAEDVGREDVGSGDKLPRDRERGTDQVSYL